MQTRRGFAVSFAALFASPVALASTETFSFPNIDGGVIDLGDLRGQPVLVVNTASMCGFTYQYEALQTLHERYLGRATILAVPSDDFGGQEYGTEAEVKEFCEVHFGLTLPMTEITKVRGSRAHPFYRWAASQGSVPRWNFHKILLDAQGRFVADFPSSVRPGDTRLTTALDKLL